MLEIESLKVGYGGIPVLHGVTLRVADGEFVAVVGPNGTGKSTLFNAISGVVPATGGAIRFDGTDLLAVAPSRAIGRLVARLIEPPTEPAAP